MSEKKTGGKKTPPIKNDKRIQAENGEKGGKKVLKPFRAIGRFFNQLFYKRSFRYGSIATAFTVFILAIVILLNCLVTYLTDKYPISADLTSTKTFSLSSETINYLSTINEPITIYICATKAQFLSNSGFATCSKIYDLYPKYCSNITLEYVDLNNNPQIVSTYSGDSISTGDMIVVCGDRHKYVSLSSQVESSYDYYSGSSTVTGYKVESAIDSALLYVTTSDLPTIELTTGHSEADTSTYLQALLTANNYNIETVNLSTSEISSDADLLIVAGPTSDFTSQEIKKIDNWITTNAAKGISKNVMILLGLGNASMPNLESYMGEWGISAGSGEIYDTTNYYQSYFYTLSGTADSDTVGNLSSNSFGLLMNARPLNMLFSSKGNYTVTSVLKSMSTSKLWNPSDLSTATFSASSSDQSGPFDVILKSVLTTANNDTTVKSTLIVSGTINSFNSTAINYSVINNTDALLNTIGSVIQYESPINVETAATDSSTLTITAIQANILFIIFVILLPIATFAFGLIVWIRRRHK